MPWREFDIRFEMAFDNGEVTRWQAIVDGRADKRFSLERDESAGLWHARFDGGYVSGDEQHIDASWQGTEEPLKSWMTITLNDYAAKAACLPDHLKQELGEI